MNIKIRKEAPVGNSLWFIISSLFLYFASSCASEDPYDQLINGTIAYPFYATNHPLGKHQSLSDNKFVIRTLSGTTEYVVEIPGAAVDYDVEVPIAAIGGEEYPKDRVKNATLTDRELVADMPKLSEATQKEKALMDKAFGVGETGGPKQAPSYTLGLSKINDLYRRGQYELSLVEINNLMAFYPTSVKLYKMKGTVLIKLRNLALAEKAWTRASELAPSDAVIKKGLLRLRRKIEQNSDEVAANTPKN